jgi:integrase
MADYLEDYRRRGGKSVEGIESVVKRNILPELGKMVVAKLTPQRLRDWHRGLAERARYWRSRKGAAANLAPFDPKDPEDVRRRRASANRVLTYLKAALNLAWRNGLVPSDDAWRRVKPFRSVEAPLVRYLSNDEMARLRNASTGGFRDLVYLALLTGCRYGELTRFKVADYNADVGTLSVRIAKGGKVPPCHLDGGSKHLRRSPGRRARTGGRPVAARRRAGLEAGRASAPDARGLRACRYCAGGRLLCAAPYPWFAARDAGGADGGDCPPARPRRHPA